MLLAGNLMVAAGNMKRICKIIIMFSSAMTSNADLFPIAFNLMSFAHSEKLSLYK